MANVNEKMSINFVQDQLVVNVNGEKRQANVKSPNKSPSNSNEDAGRKRRKQRRKFDGTAQ